MNDELKMSFDPMTIDHLGVRMYTTLPPVLAELIANSYDADAGKVEVHLKDEAEKEIVISDDGAGMTFNDINEKFLLIGRNRRAADQDVSTPKGRKTIGKKGLGKLAFFGVAHEVIITTRKDGKRNSFRMNWEDIKNSDAEKGYSPNIIERDADCSPDEHGTEIVLKQIQRKSNFNADTLADSVSQMFIVDPDFEIAICRNSESPINVTNERRYAGLIKQIEWRIPDDVALETSYGRATEVKGVLFTTEKPISPKTNMRGITLFSRKKLVNAPEYFSESTSSHFFSYLTGWLEVNFVDELDEDVISTNRQSLNWFHPEMAELRDYLRALLNKLVIEWGRKRRDLKTKELGEETGIDVESWLSKMPSEIRDLTQPVLEALVHDSELPTEITSAVARKLHTLVPEYPMYHWRYLHPEIQDASKECYERKDYYTAFLEGSKRYIAAVKAKSQSPILDTTNMMENVFREKSPALLVAEGFKKPDGTDFERRTIENVETANRYFAIGVVRGGRNVVAHEELQHLRDSKLFTENDCLDALSLLSHLFHRLDNATLTQPSAHPPAEPNQ